MNQAFGRTILFVAATTLAAASARAKRSTPAPVDPVVHDGTQYFGSYVGLRGEARERGGYVHAWDVASGKRLWNRLVYRVRYDESLEGDVQDVYITKLSVKKGRLIIDNELGEKYEMDVRSGRVTALVKKSDRTVAAAPEEKAGGE